jgi:uncharacterized protein
MEKRVTTDKLASRPSEKIVEKQSPRLAYALGVTLVLVSEFALRDVLLSGRAGDQAIGISLSAEWLVLLVLLAFWLPRIEHEGRASIGVGTFRWRYIWMGILVYLAIMVALSGSYYALGAFGLEGIRSLQPRIRQISYPVLFGLFLTGTFLEEVFYRGYLIERVKRLTGKIWIAGLVSWAAFTLVHLGFFGLGPTIDVGIMSGVLVIVYIRTGSIWPCILVHGINDVFGFLLAPLLFS